MDQELSKSRSDHLEQAVVSCGQGAGAQVLSDGVPGPEQFCLGPAGSIWVLDFMQERFYNTSPGDHESLFIEAGDR